MTAMIFFLRLISYTPSPGGVIVPAAEVIQARFGIVDVPTIAQGVRGAEGGGHGAADGHGRTPGVVGVGHHLGAAGVHKTGDIALGVFQVEIPVAVIRHIRALDYPSSLSFVPKVDACSIKSL